MARDREIACEFYECEGSCTKGRAGTFRIQCQTCNKYSPIKGGALSRPDLRRKKMDDIRRREDKF